MDLAGQILVQVADHVEEHVARGGGDQQGTLPDGGRGPGPDAEHTGSLLGDVALAPLGGEFGKAGPALPVPADVLAFVQADGAVIARGRVLHSAGRTDRQVHVHAPRYSPCASSPPGPVSPRRIRPRSFPAAPPG